jgi:hypothetical protein
VVIIQEQNHQFITPKDIQEVCLDLYHQLEVDLQEVCQVVKVHLTVGQVDVVVVVEVVVE